MKLYYGSKTHMIISHSLLLCMVIFTSVVICLLLADRKEGMHIDEYYTYGLANHSAEEGGIEISPPLGVPTPPSEIFYSYFNADTIDIENVWMNQSMDVHPPFYYLVFHLWCWVTGNLLEWGGVKTGIILNIAIHLFNILIVYLVIKKLISRENMALLGAGLYALNPGVLGTVLFIRMYTMLETFFLLLILIIIDQWDSRKSGAKFYLSLICVSIAGTLTHYYFLIYLFFTCCVYGLKLILRNDWKAIIKFLICMCISGMISFMIFPGIVGHILWGYRGVESFELLLDSDWLNNIIFFGKYINEIFGGFLLAAIAGSVLLCLYKLLVQKENIVLSSGFYVIAIPSILYFFLISKIAVMQEARYISPLYGCSIVCLVMIADFVGKHVKKNSYIVVICIVSLLLNNAWGMHEWTELHLDAKEAVEIADKYGDFNECIYFFEEGTIGRSLSGFQELMKYGNVTFVTDHMSSSTLMADDHFKLMKNVVIYFDEYIKQEKMEEILRDMIKYSANLCNSRKLYEYSGHIAYYLD